MNTQEKLTLTKSLLKQSENILIAAGAGMSQEIGLQTYWTGDDTRYGGKDKTEYGYTTLEHATEYLWIENEKAQLKYYENITANVLSSLNSSKVNHYTKLLQYLQRNNKNYWIVTTNIDTAFKHYGYNPNRVYEQHGNLFYSQCLKQPKEHSIFPTTTPAVCPECGNASRPNTLFFNDTQFNSSRRNKQQIQYEDYEDLMIEAPNKSLTIELGAGNTIANIRNHTLKLNSHYDIPAIRINPNKPVGTDGLSQILPQSQKYPILEFRSTASNFINLL